MSHQHFSIFKIFANSALETIQFSFKKTSSVFLYSNKALLYEHFITAHAARELRKRGVV